MTSSDPTDGWAAFRALFDASPLPQIQLARDGRIMRANPALAEMLGVQADRLTGGRIAGPVQGKSTARLSWDDGRCEACIFVEPLMATGDRRVCAVHFANEGALEAAAQQFLLRDLQHRLRNLIANVRSIFRRTAQTSDSVDHLTSHFLGRLDAVARVASGLGLAERHGIELHVLIMDELAAFAVRAGERALIDGPDVRLRASAATTLALAFHELSNNSVKYGALGSDTGQVAIKWWIAPESSAALHIVWQESGVDQVPPFEYSGFGTEMLTKTLPFELDGSATIHLAPGGLTTHMILPLTKRLLHE